MNRNIWITIIYNILVFFIKHEDTETQLDIPRQCHREAALFLLESLYTKSRNRNRQLTQTSEKKETFESYNIEPNVYIWTAHIFKKEKFDLLQIIYIGHFLCLIVIHYKPIMAHGRFLHTTLSPMIPNHN